MSAKVESAAIEPIAIVGGGFMGTGIAESAAVAGIDVVVREADEEAVERAGERLERSLARAVSGGKLDQESAREARGRVELTTEWAAIGHAELVVEAVPEKLELKLEVMERIDSEVGAGALITSNTSSIPIAQLASRISDRERVLGLHFFSPVPVMHLVEVVRALDTGDPAVERAVAFCARIGKQPIITKDRSGFIVNMLLVPYLMAAVRMYEEGFAAAEDIDAGMKQGCGHPMGPLALCDFIGIDVLYSVCDSLYEEFKRDEYAPPPLLKRMVAAGRLGRKAGRGFYEYP